MPRLRSLGLIADLPDMAPLSTPRSVPLRRLQVGSHLTSNQDEENARALVIRMLPCLGRLSQLWLTGIDLTTGIIEGVVQNCQRVRVLWLEDTPGSLDDFRVLSAKLSETRRGGTPLWLSALVSLGLKSSAEFGLRNVGASLRIRCSKCAQH